MRKLSAKRVLKCLNADQKVNGANSKGLNYQRGILLISAGAIEGYFEEETPRKFHEGSLVLARQCSGTPSTCNPEETGLPGLPVP